MQSEKLRKNEGVIEDLVRIREQVGSEEGWKDLER